MEIDRPAIKKILIINLAFIGDVLLSTPVARALRQAFPAAVIDMLAIPLAAPIARGNPYINDVLEYDKRGKHKNWREMLTLIRQLRARRYDLAVTTNFAPRGAMLAWASGIPYRVGYDAQHAGWFLTHIANSRRPHIRHEAENYLDVLKPLGITTDDTSLKLAIAPADIVSLREKVPIDKTRPLVIICPVGSYPQKSWTTGGFAELIQAINRFAAFYLIGTKAEAAKLAAINAAAGNLATICAGTLTLGELAAFLAEAALLVSVDTGPMHIASAVGTPIVAIFGPTDNRVWGPRGAADIILCEQAECSPCWGKAPCSDHKCMTGLKPEKVIAAALKLLGKG